MFAEATQAIESRLRTNWTTTLIDYDNVDFTPVIGTPFIRLQIEWTNTFRAGIGGRKRGEGYINISIFYPINKGSYVVNSMADNIAAIFEDWSNGAIEFKKARTQRKGQQKQWYRIDVIVPYKYDQCT